MISVEEAEKLILHHSVDLDHELVDLDHCVGRVLAEEIKADRDFPPYHRVTMDGIAIKHQLLERGERTFRITGIQAAGSAPLTIDKPDEAIEIMTGAVLPTGADTIIPYEMITINGQSDKTATVNTPVEKGKNIHRRGSDRGKNSPIIASGTLINPAEVGVAATVGKSKLKVIKPPSVAMVSTGDELVPVDSAPLPHQIRSSNSYTLAACLQQWDIRCERVHILDDLAGTIDRLSELLEKNQILVISGGVSKGKYDYVPQALDKLQVKKHFHKVKQRPGKPFWFGSDRSGTPVFAFPGNPVSSFMCFNRYMKPWLNQVFGIDSPKVMARLDGDIRFAPDLTYFAQVRLRLREGSVLGSPVEGHGSGDLANLVDADGFMELPMSKDLFRKGEIYPVYPYRSLTSDL